MPKRLRPGGGYRKTVRFQTATIIYDATYCGATSQIVPELLGFTYPGMADLCMKDMRCHLLDGVA